MQFADANRGASSVQLRRWLATPVEELTQEDVTGIAKECWQDPIFFCKYFLPHLFPKRVPWLHRGTWAVLTGRVEFLHRYGELEKIISNFVYEREGETHHLFKMVDGKLTLDAPRYILMMWPRGFSKTTLAGVASNIYDIVYEELGLGLYVSATAGHAEIQLNNVKRELETNTKLKFFFGELKPQMKDSEAWRQDQFETTTHQTMIARGRGGQVRGLMHNGQRPRKVIIDDLEDQESVATPEQRKKVREWAYADLQPVLPAMDQEARMVALGTLLHSDSLMMTWSMDPMWSVIRFGSKDRQGDLLWPENMDEEKLATLEKSAIISNTLAQFFMERHSIVRLDSTRDFQTKYFQYLAPQDGQELFVSLYQDPAIGEKEQNDRCTFTVTGMSQHGKIFVLAQEGGRGITPRDQVNTMFRLWEKWKPVRVGVESNGFQKALVFLMQEEMFRRKAYFEVTPVTNSTAKFARIKGILQPRFAAGYIYFAGRWPDLESELLNFPTAAHDDYADGLAGAVSLLDDGAFLAESAGPDNVVSLEDAIGGKWRHAV